MGEVNMKKLQVLINGQWEYVFCRSETQSSPVTTKDRRKALGADALSYFENKFANHTFKVD